MAIMTMMNTTCKIEKVVKCDMIQATSAASEPTTHSLIRSSALVCAFGLCTMRRRCDRLLSVQCTWNEFAACNVQNKFYDILASPKMQPAYFSSQEISEFLNLINANAGNIEFFVGVFLERRWLVCEKCLIEHESNLFLTEHIKSVRKRIIFPKGFFFETSLRFTKLVTVFHHLKQGKVSMAKLYSALKTLRIFISFVFFQTTLSFRIFESVEWSK